MKISKNNRLSLNELKVKSFVTEVQTPKDFTLRGGAAPTIGQACNSNCPHGPSCNTMKDFVN